MARLGDICTVVSGTTPKSTQAEYWDGDLNWVTPAELTDESDIIYDSQRKITQQAVIDSSLKSFPAGTVLLSSRAPIGKVAIAGTEMYCNQGFKNLICSDKIYNRYLYHFLKDKTDYLNSLGRGATFKEISKSIVENIEIPLPPLEEQRKIAAVLDKVSDLIAKRRQQLDKLDELVKSRFVEMFGGIKYIKRPIRELVDCKIVSARKKYGSDEKIHYIDISSIDNKANVITGTTEYVMADAPSRAQQCIEYGDILISTVRPNLRNIARNMYSGDRYVASSGFCILRAKNCDVQFLLCAVLADDFTNAMIEKTTGANYPAIKYSDVLEYHIPVPPIDLQNQFAAFAEQTDKSKLAVQKSLEKLEILKKALMQQYFG